MDTPNIPHGKGAYPGEQGYGQFRKLMRDWYGREIPPTDAQFPEAQARYVQWHDEALESLGKLKKRIHRDALWGDIFCIPKLLWESIWRAGMYSGDPTISRMAIVHTAQQEIRTQREISAAQHVQDQAARDHELKVLGESIGKTIAAEMKDKR